MHQSATTEKPPVYAIGAEYSTAADVYHAAEQVRDAGYTKWDVHTPFPVHGMDEAMGLKKSPLGYIVFGGGTLGFIIALSLVFIPSSFIYPLIVHGKPTDWTTIPAFVPILFELTVLLSALTALFGMLILNGLPRLNHPVFEWERFTRVTDDKFYIVIERRDQKFNEAATTALLQATGADLIETLYEEPDEKRDTATATAPALRAAS